MKKHAITLGILLITTFGINAKMSDTQVKQQGNDILGTLVSGHTLAFGQGDLFKAPLNYSLWNKAIEDVKKLVTTIINENKNFVGSKDSTLVEALATVTKADIDLVNSIKTIRGITKTPAQLAKQTEALSKIKNSMISLEKTLKKGSSVFAKNEAYTLLHSTALFIETTAAKAINDINIQYNSSAPTDLPPFLMQ